MTHFPELPPIYLITPEPLPGKPLSDFIAHLERVLETGIRLVQLRAKTLPARQYAKLAEQALACCRRHDARLLLNASADVALALQADGVHLTSTRLMACATRPLPSGLLIGAACHNSRQVLHAERIGADLITISPVLPTASHTIAKPLGWTGLRELALQTSVPVYALGGMSVDTLARAREAGADGIAAIRSLWGGAVE